jgi:YggT family protein
MISALLGLLSVILWALQYVVIGAVLLKLLGVSPTNPIVRLFRAITEPLFEIVRPLARKIPGSLDWSPAIVLLAITIIRRYIL